MDRLRRFVGQPQPREDEVDKGSVSSRLVAPGHPSNIWHVVDLTRAIRAN
jgi:hypothetical protein